MYVLIIYGVFLESLSVAITEGSTVAPERQAKDGVYIGCHDQVCLKKFENDIDVPQNATPDSCTASCKRYGFNVAALYNRTECACSCELNCLTKPENDNQCGLPCRGDTGRFCGGYFATAIYRILSTNTSNGQCGKNNETSLWSPGDISTITDGDYLGCYASGCLQFDYNADHLDNLTTPDSCTATCKENRFPFAGVYSGTKCSCACEQTCLTKSLDDKKCGLPCRSAPTKLCGGYTAVSVYTVHQPVKPNETLCKLEDQKEISTDPPPSPQHPVFGPVMYIALISIAIFVVITVIIVVIIRIKRRPRSPPGPLQPRSLSTHSNKTPKKTSDEHPYHVYADMAESDHKGNSVHHAPQGQTRRSDMSDEHHEYTYADQLKPIPETSDSAVETDEAGYVIPDGPSPSLRPQLVYYSSKIPIHPGKDDKDQLKLNPETSYPTVPNDEEGYIILDGPSPRPLPQEVYYSSKIPRRPGKGEGLSSQSPSPSVYYSSRIHKPKKN